AAPAARTPEAPVVPAATVVARTRIDSLLLCDSPVQSHQRACLFAHISENDIELNRVYRELLAELQSRADSVRPGGEPESVQQLRAAQREWLANRDEDCRARSREQEGELWAPVRARCFAELSDLRARELAAQLQRVRG
ncbi:MAG: lysozyme inhibitor LprI family protein, partial [Gemmatimonadaceae bacterium]